MHLLRGGGKRGETNKKIYIMQNMYKSKEIL